MLLLAPFAAAHVPHDTVRALAAPADLAPDVPWFLLANPQGTSLFLRSDDAGRTWSFLGGEPLMDDPVGAARLDDGTVVLLADTRTWWSQDEGTTWAREDLPGDVSLVAGGDALRLGGESGIWRVEPGEAIQELGVEIRRLRADVAIDSTDGVWMRTGTTWVNVGTPASDLYSVAAYDGVVYAGAADGTVWRWQGAWAACGEIPPAEHPDIVALAAGASGVLAASGELVGWHSDDGCVSWTDRGGPDDAQYGVEGGVLDVSQSWLVLETAGDSWVAGGWAGLYTTADAGGTWRDAPVVPVGHSRGVTFSRTFTEDGVVYIGGYGAGVLRTADGGQSFDAPGHGLTAENVQRVVVGPENVYAISGHKAWVSADGGADWERFGVDFSSVSEVLPWCTDDHVWLVLDLSEGIRTTSDGETYRVVNVPLLGAEAVGAVEFGERMCVTAAEPATVVCSEGGEWSTWYLGDSDRITFPVAWPFEEPSRLIFADEDGVHTTDDGGVSWQTPLFDEDPPAALVSADDGTLVLATRSGRVMRSADGGDSWTDPGYRLSATPNVLAARPGFAAHPDVLVGTHDGLWLLRGEEPPVRWAAYERLDNTSDFFDRTNAVEAVPDGEAGMDSVAVLEAGTTYTAWVRGERLRVLGTSDGNGEVYLLVDGVSLESFGDTVVTGIGTLVEVDGLDPGWHLVSLVGGGSGTAFDALEAWGESALLDAPDEAAGPERTCPSSSTTEPPCGCGGSSGGALLLFGALAWRRRTG